MMRKSCGRNHRDLLIPPPTPLNNLLCSLFAHPHLVEYLAYVDEPSCAGLLMHVMPLGTLEQVSLWWFATA